jgi:hypothetical protein
MNFLGISIRAQHCFSHVKRRHAGKKHLLPGQASAKLFPEAEVRAPEFVIEAEDVQIESSVLMGILRKAMHA